MGGKIDIGIQQTKYSKLINGLKEGQFQNIVFLTGAGISTAAGIPDFRSKTGVFAEVKKKYFLFVPEQMFLLFTFYRHPEHFYEFCKHFNIDHCKPTKTHLFMSFLNSKGFLLRIFTQNVDGLEKKAEIPRDMVINCHGVIDEAHCPNCRKDVDFEKLRSFIMEDKILYCEHCGKPCKPKVVFYGEQLPDSFNKHYYDIEKADLTFIIGTTLKVTPFADLAYDVPKDSWRVVLNNEVVGKSFGEHKFLFNNPNKNDIFLNGMCDDTVQKIVDDCGWSEDFKIFCDNILQKLNK